MMSTYRMEDNAITGNVDLAQILIQAGCTPEQVQAFIRRWNLTSSPLRGHYAE